MISCLNHVSDQNVASALVQRYPAAVAPHIRAFKALKKRERQQLQVKADKALLSTVAARAPSVQKVFVCGDSYSGKTTLVSSLTETGTKKRFSPASRAKHRDRTAGIDLTRVTYHVRHPHLRLKHLLNR